MRGILSFVGLWSLACAALIPEARDADLSVESRAASTNLTNGNGIVYGSDGVMIYDASGILTKGCNTAAISYCYGMYLSPNASQNLDTNHLDSPRQRNEFHFPALTANQSFSYSWKQYLDPTVNGSTHFFYIMQVFGANEQLPVAALTILKSNLVIVDSATPHGTFGPSGKLNYQVTSPSGPIISYSRSGGLATGGGYIKFGTYRLTFSPNMSPVSTMVGDWKTIN
ncbi:hypothetical protein FB45DRAFT_894716 [Roridomyces roridus]|uniref:Uncharacterized protein n=1 Tax=Roridomyces roridus TaxID=1738132 RepID=A0AAD7CGL0_9AGAR|nr:hypothetical protein FB45DRAFT_894716 [Roridomyces roridus]